MKGEARKGGKEGDREKGIRAGITLGDCGIVNPCRVALVLLLFLSPTVSPLSLSISLALSLSRSLYLSFPPSLLPPTLSVSSIALPLYRSPFLLSSLFLSCFCLAFSLLYLSYPSYGLVRRQSIGEQARE